MTDADRSECDGDLSGLSPRVVATIRRAIELVADERPDLADELRELLGDPQSIKTGCDTFTRR